jgi:hypothetical protein
MRYLPWTLAPVDCGFLLSREGNIDAARDDDCAPAQFHHMPKRHWFMSGVEKLHDELD